MLFRSIEPHRPQRVAQGLQVAVQPGEAGAKRIKPQLLGERERDGAQAATATLVPTPWLRSSVQSCCSTALASPNTMAVWGSSNSALAMPA